MRLCGWSWRELINETRWRTSGLIRTDRGRTSHHVRFVPNNGRRPQRKSRPKAARYSRSGFQSGCECGAVATIRHQAEAREAEQQHGPGRRFRHSRYGVQGRLKSQLPRSKDVKSMLPLERKKVSRPDMTLPPANVVGNKPFEVFV